MHSTEYTANAAFQANAEECARWAAVLARPATSAKRAPRMVRHVSMLARIVALFA